MTTPLHTTVAKADPGDAGWIWWLGEWHVAQITGSDDDDDPLFVEILFTDRDPETHLFDDEHIAGRPWMPIMRPPYEGDEKPNTHRLTLEDSQASWSLSWTMAEEKGDALSKQLFAYAQQLLKEAK